MERCIWEHVVFDDEAMLNEQSCTVCNVELDSCWDSSKGVVGINWFVVLSVVVVIVLIVVVVGVEFDSFVLKLLFGMIVLKCAEEAGADETEFSLL